MRQVSYNKLWKLLIDRGMRKEDLRIETNLSSGTIAKLSKDKNVTVDVLLRICDTLDCDIEDILETVCKPSKGCN